LPATEIRHIILGTAGHVDHGKSALVKALTGTDPDRLQEEQERGMTIDLGYAALDLPGEQGDLSVSIVDVPGHERFLKNMLTGAGAIDMALLVVAADEGVMPQTADHIAALHLLGLRQGVVAVSKCAGVDADWLAEVDAEIRSAVRGTFLERARIVHIDSLEGLGLEDLRGALAQSGSATEVRDHRAPFRFQVDSAFTKPGFGSVARGALLRGSLKVGDSGMAYPAGLPVRVRALQAHGRRIEAAVAGMRLGVNLAGIEVSELTRGTVVAPSNTIAVTTCLECALSPAPRQDMTIYDRQRVRVHLGGFEAIGRLRTRRSSPDASAPLDALLVLESAVACSAGDRFVLRRYSPPEILCGGRVLNPSPVQRGRRSVAAVHGPRSASPDSPVGSWLDHAPLGGTAAAVSRSLGIAVEDAVSVLDALCAEGKCIRLETQRFISRAALDALRERALSALSAYHAANPLRAGMPLGELRHIASAPGGDRSEGTRAVEACIRMWADDGLIVVEGPTVRLPSFRIRLNERQKALLARVSDAYRSAAFEPPATSAVSREIGAPPSAVEAMVRIAVEQGELVRVAPGVYYHAGAIARVRRLVTDEIRRSGSITVGRLRDLTGTSRKYAVPLAEYLDASGLTRRVGDTRVLAEGAACTGEEAQRSRP